MDNRVTSIVYDRFWLVSIYEDYKFNKPSNERSSGKWLIFDEPDIIDEYWKVISKDLQLGNLGPSVKVASAKININANDDSTRVICVYTEDFSYKEYVERIKDRIRSLGINNKLIYKLYENVGLYSHLGHHNKTEYFSMKVDKA